MGKRDSSRGTVSPAGDDAARVGNMIARGESKSALDLAKQIHKRAPSDASERLLIEAYLARVQSMVGKRMLEEADALAALVRDRFPAAAPRLREIVGAIALHRGDLGELVRPLLDPDLPRESKAAIEETIRTQVVDLRSLAGCGALPAEHPLRRGAAALTAAFDAVTRGPVTDDALELPEISRRGPLASWKALVRAIAAFYRREDEACRRHLGAVEPGSVPARLVPVLTALCSGTPGSDLPGSAARLVGQIDGGHAELAAALAALERSFAAAKPKNTLKLIPPALESCRRAAPDLAQRLRVRIAVRALALDIPPESLDALIGKPPLQEAEYYRLFAATLEKYHAPELLPAVFDAWSEYRRLALKSGRVETGSIAEATLFGHLAELLATHTAEDLAEARETYEEETFDAAGGARKGSLSPEDFSPQALFARSCAIDPDGESFAAWVSWAKKQGSGKSAEKVAETWHDALPRDVRPLLHLVATAQRRGAFQRALTWLAKAEQLDAVNPEVHRARMRLLVVAALRHLHQNKARLLEADTDALAALPLFREGDRPAFIEALRWCACQILGREPDAVAARAEVTVLIGEVAAATLLSSLARHGSLAVDPLKDFVPGLAAGQDQPKLAADVARACALGAGVGYQVRIPAQWQQRLIAELAGKRDGRPLPPVALHELAVAATYGGPEGLRVAYAATTAGIDDAGELLPRFLLLRARVLPQSFEDRRVALLAAALDLARRQRDQECVEQVLELKPTLSWRGAEALEISGKQLSDAEIQDLLENERRQRTFPTGRPSTPPPSPTGRNFGAPVAPCDCPECRAGGRGRRRKGPSGLPPLDPAGFLEELERLAREHSRQKKAASRKARDTKGSNGRQGDLFDPT